MPDLDITCAECGNPLFHSPNENRTIIASEGLSHPKRCKPCRDARRSNFGGPRQSGGGGRRRGASGSRSFAISAARRTPFHFKPQEGPSNLV